ncbi:hypothetical protein EJB05_02958, partial [Eragrostis curvula]
MDIRVKPTRQAETLRLRVMVIWMNPSLVCFSGQGCTASVLAGQLASRAPVTGKLIMPKRPSDHLNHRRYVQRSFKRFQDFLDSV